MRSQPPRLCSTSFQRAPVYARQLQNQELGHQCVRFLGLLKQMTTNLVAQSKSSHCSGGQKSKIKCRVGFLWRLRGAVCVSLLEGLQGRNSSLPLSAPGSAHLLPCVCLCFQLGGRPHASTQRSAVWVGTLEKARFVPSRELFESIPTNELKTPEFIIKHDQNNFDPGNVRGVYFFIFQQSKINLSRSHKLIQSSEASQYIHENTLTVKINYKCIIR